MLQSFNFTEKGRTKIFRTYILFSLRATEKNTEIVQELEQEMEQQVAILEAKIREEERLKLEQQKHEANFQITTAQQELVEMEQKVKKVSLNKTENSVMTTEKICPVRMQANNYFKK